MIQVSAEGDRAPGEVWQDFVDPASWPAWAPHLHTVCGLPSPIVPRARGIVRGPLGLCLPVRITEVDHEAMLWGWAVGPGRFVLRMRHRVEAVHGPATPSYGSVTRSRATVIIEAPALPFALYAPLARWALKRLVNGGR